MTEEYGQWLGRQLRRNDMTQSDLALKVGVTRAAVSTWMSGRVMPRVETLQLVESVLGVMPGASMTMDETVGRDQLAWYHRPAHRDGGREYGNAATFAFEPDLEVLARETTQNSLDEVRDDAGPVRVCHVLHEISGERLELFKRVLQWDTLRSHYESAAGQGQKTGRALARGLREMEQKNSLILLRIDDYNANGLTGSDYGNGRFSAVVRRQLDSHKTSAGAGGSYGLGKATLWAASSLGMVLINSTLSEPLDGHYERRLIGRIDLPWHELEGDQFAGPAWFGEPDPDRDGATRSWWADDATVEALHLKRDNEEPGSSFLVVGAHEGIDEEADLEAMHARLVRGLGHNFWASMVASQGGRPLLEASVIALRNGVEIVPEKRVDPQEFEPARTRALKAFLDGTTVDRLTAPESVVARYVPLTVPPLRVSEAPEEAVSAEHRAVLLVTPAEDEERPNQLVCMRSNRMVVMAQTINPPIGSNAYQAVLLAGTGVGSQEYPERAAERFLRTAEPPDHNAWKRTEDLVATYARGAVKSITDFRGAMREAVLELTTPVGDSVEREAIPEALRDVLRIDVPKGPPRNSRSFPTIDDLQGRLNDDGAWEVTAEVSLPQQPDPWTLAPVLRFVTRSGPKPVVRWASLAGERNCEVTPEGTLRFKPGVRVAVFRGVSDVSDHPVVARLARIEVDVQRAKEQNL